MESTEEILSLSSQGGCRTNIFTKCRLNTASFCSEKFKNSKLMNYHVYIEAAFSLKDDILLIISLQAQLCRRRSGRVGLAWSRFCFLQKGCAFSGGRRPHRRVRAEPKFMLFRLLLKAGWWRYDFAWKIIES